MDSNSALRKKLIWQTIFAVLIIVTLVIMLIIQYTQFWALTIKESELKDQLALLEKEHYIFEQEYNYKSSDEYIEDYAREVLNWGREGESYYR